MLYASWRGFVAFAVAFGAAIGIQHTIDNQDEGVGMMIAAPLLAAIDVGYRRVVGLRWFDRRGPTILWLPTWLWGAFWFVLGAGYHWLG